MAVSVGTGIYPPEKLGEVDFFSKGLLDLRGTLNRAKKLIKMLSTAVSLELAYVGYSIIMFLRL